MASLPKLDLPNVFVQPGELHARRPLPLPTGLAPLDELLGGGLPEGRITELCGARGGRTAVALHAAARLTVQGRLVALVDGSDALDPRSAAAIGVDLQRLLWVRMPPGKLAGASDALLRGGAFSLVILDLAALPPRALPVGPAWVRLARAAESARASLLVLNAHAGKGPGFCAAAALALSRSRVAHTGRGPGRLLQGFSAEVELVHNKLGRPAATAQLEWRAP